MCGSKFPKIVHLHQNLKIQKKKKIFLMFAEFEHARIVSEVRSSIIVKTFQIIVLTA